MYFFGVIGVHSVCLESEIWSKLTYIMNFGHFSYFIIPPNMDMNAFSGIISLLRLLVHSELLHVLIWYYRGS